MAIIRTVTTLIDELDTDATAANPGGTGFSLREALGDIPFGEQVLINFDPSLSGGTMRMASLPLLVGQDVTVNGDIDGNGSPDITITGDWNGDDILIPGTGLTDVEATIAAGKHGDNGGLIWGFGQFHINGLILTGGRSTNGGAIDKVSIFGGDQMISNSVLVGNYATGNGGAIDGDNWLRVINSTIAGNVAGGHGGGIYGESVVLINSTVTGNSAGASSGGLSAHFYEEFYNSIVIGNSAPSVDDYEPGVGFIPVWGGGNIVGGTVLQGTGTVIGTTTVVEVFAALDANGGGTITLVNGVPVIRLNGSLDNYALDGGSDSYTIPLNPLSNDVAGQPRYAGPGVSHNGTNIRDIGSYEATPNEQPSLVVTTLDDVVSNLDGVTSLREAILYANSKAGIDYITFDAALAGGTIRLDNALGSLSITDELTIVGDVDNDGTADIIITGDSAGNDTTIAGSITDIVNMGGAALADNVQIFTSTADIELNGLVLTGGVSSTEGGAIAAGANNVFLFNVTLSGNHSDTYGGALHASVASLTNTTVAGNTADIGGGGFSAATAYLANATVTGNVAAQGAGFTASDADLTNSIVLGNFGASDAAISGSIATHGGNIIGADVLQGTTVVGTTTAAAVFAAVDAATGGGVLTLINGVPLVALNASPGNPALDAGSDALGFMFDARGHVRVDLPSVAHNGTNISDLGAVEALQVDSPQNDAPVAEPVSLGAIAEDSGARTITAAELLTGVSDVDGPALSITALSIATGGGTLTQTDATTWSYTPALNDDTAVTFNYTAWDGTLSASSTASLDIMPVNDAPVVVSVSLGAIAENSGARTITAAELLIGVSDVEGAALSITALRIQTGGGTLTQIDATNWSYTPAPDDDTAVTFVYTASDGTASNIAIASLDITPVNNVPVLGGVTSPVTFAENTVNTTPQILDADVAFTDPNDNFDGGTLTVAGLLAEDTVSIRNQGGGAGQIGFSAGTVTFGGTAIGTVTGGNGATLTVTFNAAATSAAVDALIQNLTYANSSDTPTASRTLTITVTDAAGAVSRDLTQPGFAEVTGAANPFSAVDVGLVSAPVLGDLDGDGDLDAVVGDFHGLLHYFQNTGTAAVPVYVEQTAGANPFNTFDVGGNAAPALADLDDDGDLDAIVGDDFGTIRYFTNSGSASAPVFTEQTGAANPFNGFDTGSFATPSLGDLDGDGDLDAVAGGLNGTVNYFENTGTAASPTFVERTGAQSPFSSFSVGLEAAPRLVDIDGDGDLDLLAGTSNGRILTFENTGTNNSAVFEIQVGLANPFSGFNFSTNTRPDFADIDGDGDLDAVVGVEDGTLRTLINTSAAGSPIVVNVTAENDAPVLTGVASPITFMENAVNTTPQLLDADVTFTDGDNNFSGGALTVSGLLAEDSVSIRNQGTAAGEIGFSAGTVTYGGTAIGTATGGNGTALTVTFNASATSAAIEALIENLTYANSSDTPTASRTLHIEVTDAAGDSTLAPFSPVQLPAASDPFNQIVNYLGAAPTLGDLDGDGDLDALVGTVHGQFAYYLSIGAASAPVFVEQTGAANPLAGFDLGEGATPCLVDLNGDGLLDVVSGAQDGAIRYFLNTGTASVAAFAEQTGGANPVAFTPTLGFSAVAFADMDGDGDQDMAVGGFEGVVDYFENTGSATAPSFVERTGAANPFDGINFGIVSTPSLGDLDGDGDIDIFSGNRDGGLYYVLNAGTATAPSFGAIVSLNVDIGFQSTTALADLDGDGDLDVVAGANALGLVTFESGVADGIPIVVNVTAENDAPVLTGVTSPVTFLENTVNVTPQLLDADVTLTDVEGNFDGGSLTVSGMLAEDIVSIRNQGAAAGQIGFGVGTVTFGGTAIGTVVAIAGSLTVTFNAAATAAAIEALIENLTYANASDTPTASRTLTITVTDAAADATNAAIVVNVTGESDIGVAIVGTNKADVANGASTPTGQPLPTSLNDTILGNNGNDDLSGLGGHDTIHGGKGNDILRGGGGNDILQVKGQEGTRDVFEGGTGTDTLQFLGTGNVRLAGFNATASSIEILQGNGKAITGTQHADAFDFGGLSAMTNVSLVDGGGGNDTLIGSAFADNLRGGGGNDIVDGRGGNDVLTGGAGIDTFIFADGYGADTVRDYKAGQDIFDFTGVTGVNDFGDLFLTQIDANTVLIDFDGVADGDTLTIQKTTIAALAANQGDFVFT